MRPGDHPHGRSCLEIEQPYFEVEGEPATRKLQLVGTNSWTIGRSPDNAFVFEDDAMSRRHALIQQMQPGKFYLIDLGSRNGSSLNGRRITTSVELHEGDSVICGESTLVFHNPSGETATTAGDTVAQPSIDDERVTLTLY